MIGFNRVRCYFHLLCALIFFQSNQKKSILPFLPMAHWWTNIGPEAGQSIAHLHSQYGLDFLLSKEQYFQTNFQDKLF